MDAIIRVDLLVFRDRHRNCLREADFGRTNAIPPVVWGSGIGVSSGGVQGKSLCFSDGICGKKPFSFL
jgi:hypothetical protein